MDYVILLDDFHHNCREKTKHRLNILKLGLDRELVRRFCLAKFNDNAKEFLATLNIYFLKKMI
jgi:hypothetical protein